MGFWLRKRWFLLLLLGGATLALSRPQTLQWTNHLDPRLVVALVLFLTSWTMPGRHLIDMLVRPWPALWGFFLSAAVVPLGAWLLMSILPTAFGIGLLISASVPCTLASALLWTRRARGDEATVLLVILLCTGSAWLTTTAWLSLGTGTVVEVDGLAMMFDLLVILLLPFGLGQLCRWGPPGELAKRRQTALGVVAQVLILSIMLKAAAQVGLRLHVETDALLGVWVLIAMAASLGLHTAALALGMATSRGLGFAWPQSIAVAFSCSQKTLPVAMLLYERYFQAYPLAVLPLAFYHFGQLIVDTFVADALARPLNAGIATERKMAP